MDFPGCAQQPPSTLVCYTPPHTASGHGYSPLSWFPSLVSGSPHLFPWAFRLPRALLDMALLLGRCSDLGPGEESLPVASRLLPEDLHLPWPSGSPAEGPAQEG